MTDTAIPETAGPAWMSPLPPPRGPVSQHLVERLRERPGLDAWPLPPAPPPDPYGDDAQLALTILYELHYRGFADVDPGWEWAPGPLALRAMLEEAFLGQLRRDVPAGDDVDATFERLCREPADAQGVSHHLAAHGSWEQMREFFVHRSIYHLKEADPQAWAIPRLIGRAKAAFVAVEFDEFGGGRDDRIHSSLFADLLIAAGLSADYLGYLDDVPAVTLATVNVMSLCGLHRARLGMLAGLFADAEITSSPNSARMVRALERLAAPRECVRFYAEHVEADAVHELVLRHDVVGDLLRRDPGLAGDVVFGVKATEFLEGRLARHLLDRWQAGTSSLRGGQPLQRPGPM